jgi:Tfp pilus assembly protein PilF
MRRNLFICLLLAGITLAVFWPVSRYDFINYDDPEYVTENVRVQQGLTPSSAAWAFQAVVCANWHPLTCLSHMLDCQLFGLNAGAHHLVNLLFHVANTLLLFHVLRRTTREMWPSAMVAALFALHPLHVESVAWVSERKDMLSTFFGFLTLWAYSRWAQGQSRVEPSSLRSAAPGSRESSTGSSSLALDPRSSAIDYGLALFFFALGLMSKPMLVTWPFVLLLLDFWPLKRFPSFKVADQGSSAPPRQQAPFHHLIWEKLPFFALAATSSIITFLVQLRAGAIVSAVYLPFSERSCNASISYIRYLGKTIWPGHLSVYYPYHGAWPEWLCAGSVVLLAAITFAAVWQARHRPFLIFGWLWFLGTLVPVIGLVQVGNQSLADRYSYIPLIGVFVMIVWSGKEIAGRWPQGKPALSAAIVATLAVCIVVTRLQIGYWRNSETLFRHALDVTTQNSTAHFSLGNALIDKGKIEEGMAHLSEALRISPSFAEVHGKIAETLARQGKIRQSIEHNHEALRYKPDLPEVLNNLAWTLATNEDPQIRRGAEAVQLAERACGLTHYQKTIYVGTLAAAYAEAGRFDDAISTAQKACTLASELGDQNLLKRNQELLALYLKHQPYHEVAGPDQTVPSAVAHPVSGGTEKLVPAAP